MTGIYLDPLLELMNKCLENSVLPGIRLEAKVAIIFKKGYLAEMENYPPICLTSVAYRLFAGMIKQQLLVEVAIWLHEKTLH